MLQHHRLNGISESRNATKEHLRQGGSQNLARPKAGATLDQHTLEVPYIVCGLLLDAAEGAKQIHLSLSIHLLISNLFRKSMQHFSELLNILIRHSSCPTRSLILPAARKVSRLPSPLKQTLRPSFHHQTSSIFAVLA